MLATLVEGDQKAPFSIATTLRSRGGHNSIPWIFHFTLNPYLIILSVKQVGIKCNFLSLWYDLTWDWTPVFWTIDGHSTIRPMDWIVDVISLNFVKKFVYL